MPTITVRKRGALPRNLPSGGLIATPDSLQRGGISGGPRSLARNLPAWARGAGVNGSLTGFRIEPLVRRYESADPNVNRVVQRLIKKHPSPLDGEATLRWGGPPNWEARQPDFPTVTISWPDNEEEGNVTAEIPTLEFEEIERLSEDVRIENPDDPEQYVIERRPQWVKFKGPDLRPEGGIPGLEEVPSTFRFPYIFWRFTYTYTETQAS